MTPDEFRRLGHLVVDWIADYRAQVEGLPVLARVAPGSVRAGLPTAPPVEPGGFEAVLADLDRQIVPALSHWQHPRCFAYFPSNGDLAAVLGDMLSTGLGVLGLNWASSPALTELEQVCVDWLRQASGLAAGWRGVIQDTASTCTLIALLSAREHSTGHGAATTGMQHGGPPLIVYTSAEAHSSVVKAALLAGFGRDHVRLVPTDPARAIDPAALATAITADLARGCRPCAIIATSGTTTTVAFDPIDACAEVAARHALWLHVDAAMAGSAMLLPERRHLWHGIDRADSIVVNPHKWLGASFDCSVYFVRDEGHLVSVMSTNPSYLRTAVDDQVVNFRDWGIALGRRFRALKLWSLFRCHGTTGLQTRLRRDLDNARWLADRIAATPPWRLLAPLTLQTLCVRHEPPGLSGPELDSHTLAWLERVHDSGQAWLTPAQLDGHWMVRISIGALATERRHVAELWELLQAEADR